MENIIPAKPDILLTNDDGIRSPGLWAAAEALSALGFVHVVAPREQFSGAGRSLPNNSDGVIQAQEVHIHGQPWQVYSVGGAPAQAVLHAALEILPRLPDLLVSGINYGENVGSGITISGTVGAALEGAALGIPSLAVSLETETHQHYSYSEQVDFSSAAQIAAYFASLALSNSFPPDVDVLKVDIPCDATLETPWAITRVSRKRYFEPIPPQRASWDVPAKFGYRQSQVHECCDDDPDSDAYVLRVRRMISVTPLSLDLTSRLDLAAFERTLRKAR
ncbi:MAG: 5'/3'-nucleotidase SurE [Anaerolineales bacterium]|nr:5'/3'-nucleotidase SurE [Anaerolineales bacterium]